MNMPNETALAIVSYLSCSVALKVPVSSIQKEADPIHSKQQTLPELQF
jgi:predicted ATP-grasp superfamily ATP-dependent carboligase